MWPDTTQAQCARADLALPKRFDRCQMGTSRTVLSKALARGPTAQVAAALDCRGNPVSAARRPAMADAGALLSAGLDSAALVLTVARQRVVTLAQSRPAVDRARGGWS